MRMGLAISRTIVEAHRGLLLVENDPTGGDPSAPPAYRSASDELAEAARRPLRFL
jgi:signal transduction histidine kinase